MAASESLRVRDLWDVVLIGFTEIILSNALMHNQHLLIKKLILKSASPHC